MEKDKIYIYTEGFCEPVSPGGFAYCGYYIWINDKEVFKNRSYVGAGWKMSLNVAEYQAVIEALEKLDALGYGGKDITIFTQSRLVEKQMMGRWKVYSGNYISYYQKALAISQLFPILTFKPAGFKKREDPEWIGKMVKEKLIATTPMLSLEELLPEMIRESADIPKPD